jgi:glutathione synthase/RimK-type ligase-like ATP-grasp enzyme
MILVIGNPDDAVIGRVTAALRSAGAPLATVDVRVANTYKFGQLVDGGSQRWQIHGGDCVGRRAVGAIFMRPDTISASDRETVAALRALRHQIDLVLLGTVCTVINNPARTDANVSKPYQLRQMAAAGFAVPRTLVTNLPSAALGFISDLGGRVIFKGISHMKTLPQVLQPHHLEQLSWLERCPTQFQEFIAGDDFRVTVVDTTTVVTRIVGGEVDASSTSGRSLSTDVLQLCVRFTQQQGLVMSGIDVRLTSDGREYAFELNPFPLFTYYESENEPRITDRVVEYLLEHQYAESDVKV